MPNNHSASRAQPPPCTAVAERRPDLWPTIRGIARQFDYRMTVERFTLAELADSDAEQSCDWLEPVAYFRGTRSPHRPLALLAIAPPEYAQEWASAHALVCDLIDNFLVLLRRARQPRGAA